MNNRRPNPLKLMLRPERRCLLAGYLEGDRSDRDPQSHGYVRPSMSVPPPLVEPEFPQPNSMRNMINRNVVASTSNSPRKTLPNSGTSKAWPNGLPGNSPRISFTKEH